ncbi:hypothetical protein APSETT445_006299 [Aspergillus pseudonomiae]
MNINSTIQQVAYTLGYGTELQTHLSKALMAPGTDGERLADCGIDLIRSCLSQYGYEMNIQPSKDLQDPERSINLTGKPLFTDLDCTKTDKEYGSFFTQEDNAVDPTLFLASINRYPHLPIGLSGNDDSRATMVDLLPNTVQDSKSKRSANISFDSQKKLKQGRRQRYNSMVRFLEEETMKCHAKSLRPPQESYFTAEIEMAIQNPDLKQWEEVSKRLILGSGSSLSVLFLKEAIQTWRARADMPHLQISKHSSKAETYANISLIDQRITGLNLFRRYHISHLFEACGGHETPSVSRFIATPAFTASGIKRAGNPLKNAESEMTTAMMKKMLPGLEPGSSEYKKGYKDVNNLRLLARRFHTLQEHFGKGILALIPYPQHPHQPGLELSDNM